MRPLVVNFCALAGVFVFAVAACASETRANPRSPADEARSAPRAVKCLGGVLNEDPAASYLAVGDYPAQAAAPAGGRRAFVCGDRIPSFIPWLTYRSGAGLHGR